MRIALGALTAGLLAVPLAAQDVVHQTGRGVLTTVDRYVVLSLDSDADRTTDTQYLMTFPDLVPPPQLDEVRGRVVISFWQQGIRMAFPRGTYEFSLLESPDPGLPDAPGATRFQGEGLYMQRHPSGYGPISSPTIDTRMLMERIVDPLADAEDALAREVLEGMAANAPESGAHTTCSANSNYGSCTINCFCCGVRYAAYCYTARCGVNGAPWCRCNWQFNCPYW
jgi:hypothetical protein